MDYRAKNCNICGCDILKEISSNTIAGNVFYTYKCLACGENFSTLPTDIKIENCSNAKIPTDKMSAADIYKLNNDKTVAISADFADEIAFGSGILIGNGYILTNAHVITEKSKDGKTDFANTVAVTLNNAAPIEVDWVCADTKKDLALLYSDKLTNKVAICKTKVSTGDKIFVIGNSKGEGICVLDGLISDNERFINGEPYIMISAPVTAGNSGGPVFNEIGELVGVVTSGKKDIQSMNYAIPVSEIIAFVHNIEKKEGIVVNL